MAAIPRETIMTTLMLLGIGLVLVIALLIFTFSILKGPAGYGEPGTGTPTARPDFNYQTPTPEYMPNSIYDEPVSPTPVPTEPAYDPFEQLPESIF